MAKRFGFTLAEVLITLGIIGVVAAMTMPTLINQTNGAQFRAAFKKELSVISQAAALNQALEDWDFSGLQNTEGSKLSDLLKARTNVVSEISTDALPEDYKPKKGTSDWSKDDFDLDSDKPSETSTSVKYFIFNDGSMFIFDDEKAVNCTDVTVGTTAKKHCHGYFDVNGFKGPNKVNTCDNSSATDGNDCYVKSPTDIFPVIFYDQTILPGSKAGQAVLADRTKEVKASE